MDAPKRSRKMLAFSDVDDVGAEPGFMRGGMFARPLFPLPIMAFIKDQVVFWPSWGFSFSMNDSQACFFAAMISLFFTASAFSTQPFSLMIRASGAILSLLVLRFSPLFRRLNSTMADGVL